MVVNGLIQHQRLCYRAVDTGGPGEPWQKKGNKEKKEF